MGGGGRESKGKRRGKMERWGGLVGNHVGGDGRRMLRDGEAGNLIGPDHRPGLGTPPMPEFCAPLVEVYLTKL